jgi:hypothetical protein
MTWRPLLALMALLAPYPALADTNLVSPPGASYLCRQAITAAERAHGIPSHLLAAIARVESGRRDQASNTFNPWPWTINVDGQGSFYDSKPQAVASANALRVHAVRSIDVGCMQISLMYHPDAFASMDQAFDPRVNADYGARFLVQLFEKTGSWPKAVELYHSATQELGRDYQQKVYAAWPEEKKLAELAAPPGLFNAMTAPASTLPSLTAPNARPMFSSLFRQSASHIIMRMPNINGEMPAGRTLEAYRQAPVRLAFRAP